MNSGWRFFFNRLRQRLWVRPLVFCVLSVGLALLARLADGTGLRQLVLPVAPESLVTLLQVMASSMLVIATFAVGSMVSAYASASSTATPRSFAVVVADDVSQNALSTFVGAFIFSIVALIAIQNDYYAEAGRFVLLALTLFVFGSVIVTFVKWVDSIARLGRLGSTVRLVEASALTALRARWAEPRMGGAPAGEPIPDALTIYAQSIGYVQRVDMATLQACAEADDLEITVTALPGVFAGPGRALATLAPGAGALDEARTAAIREAFVMGVDRTFDEDPRFGLVVLSEIACRALSPAVNDPGTAIDVLGSFVRLFATWGKEPGEDERRAEGEAPRFPRVAVPELQTEDMFDDAFRALAREGAGTIEVMERLIKVLGSLAGLGHPPTQGAAHRYARLALDRASKALTNPEELALLRELAGGVEG